MATSALSRRHFRTPTWLSRERTSEPFLIDHEGPRVTIAPRDRGAVVTLKDNLTRLVKAAYALDSGEWVSVFPDETYKTPRSWAERVYPHLIYFHEADKGGHFAAWEQPQLFSEEIRAAFRSLR